MGRLEYWNIHQFPQPVVRSAKLTQLLLKLLQHPVWLVGGCWVGLVVAGVVAWRSLADYDLANEPILRASPSVVAIQPPVISVQPAATASPISQDSSDSVPPWSLGLWRWGV
ncbi:MAG: hypothetical protein HC881_02430 [Leptolyngbyaceae cyanobacterium SL_7_1]|nr:hypothetical protein [Leptolyngbyaceae cyanobacterium SL_7_1]